MATSSSSQPDTQLLSVGKQCSDSACLLVDFLPFKCQHCQLSFCQEHFKVDAHKCSKYDESKFNRVAPNCPLCNIPVAVRPGQDPNVRMDIHLESECSVVTGKVKAKTTPLCARPTCKKVLFSPIRCTSCRRQFCPAHRFPGDHSCSGSSPVPPKPNAFANLNSGAKNLHSKASATGAAAMGAVKKTMAADVTPGPQPSSSSSRPSLPFNKMDRLSDISSATNLNEIPDCSVTVTHEPLPSPTTKTDKPIIKPSPIIDPMSFIPRPIFASA
ncbi:hypothetical protein M413DRAFT_444110 [Hebeloma cylindrosporum]|uniref:AN1-type domain-containing protein n=1 Tax=Hebeloma cylindrosporum TaxID=76867 RepID=A0A0C3CI56_HEBCY|nr:hypothetical protein M413DRAFT_444110 [Hebeloma cylindrosporum h7]